MLRRNLLFSYSCSASSSSSVSRFASSSTFCGLFSRTSPLLGTVVPYLLADIGEGILQVEVKEWFVKPGDTVTQFQKVCEVQSDKSTATITSRYDGVIRKLYVAQNEMAFSGKPLVDIETDAAVAPSQKNGTTTTTTTAKKAAEEEAKSAEKQAAASSSSSSHPAYDGKSLAPPSVRRIAAENNISLASVTATGKGGRVITKEDILNFIKTGGAVPSAFPSSSSSSATTAASSSPLSLGAVPEDKAIKITGVKRIMVQSMTKANNIPAFGASDEIEISKLTHARDALRPVFAARFAQQNSNKKDASNLKLSFMPFFIKAASIALAQFPDINAHTNDDCTVVTLKGAHNIGFAMDTPQGLIVPVVRNVQTKSLYDIAVDIAALVDRGAANALTTADLQGATFTLSNIGSIGATYTKPVINPPQVAIGALGRGRVLPRFDAHGNVVKATIVEVSWSADHRVVDGATMVRFGNMFRDLLESPVMMLAHTR